METGIEVVKYGGSLFLRLPPLFAEKLKTGEGKKLWLMDVSAGVLIFNRKP